jgi:hypothetical protein
MKDNPSELHYYRIQPPEEIYSKYIIELGSA